MIKIESIQSDFNLYNKIENISEYYKFFDLITYQLTGNKDIKIRQIVEKQDLQLLSEARKRMYGKRDEYFKKLYKNDLFIDEVDYRSYIFACFLNGEIIGTQRASGYPFEVNSYINSKDISDLLGINYQEDYLEFSRLLIDKDAKINNLSNILGFVTGSFIALSSDSDKYITYSKSKLKRKSLTLSERTIKFKISERNEDEYELFMGSMIEDIRKIFSIKGENSHSVISGFRKLILKPVKIKENN